jgi:hypothetical protein
MWRKWGYIAVGTIVVAVAIILVARQTPGYSLYWFRLALETRDPRTFDAWVDEEAVVIDLAKTRVAQLHGKSGLAGDPMAQPDPEAVAMIPAMHKEYRRDIRAYLLGQNPEKPLDRTYLLGEVVRNGAIAETTFTPDLPQRKPWRIRILQQSGGLWKVVSIQRDK